MKLIVVILVLVLPTQAFAAPSAKSGATCSKLNITQTIGNIKFTCIKSGKKLNWNKGVSSTPKLLPTPKSTPTPTPTPTPTLAQTQKRVTQIGEAFLPIDYNLIGLIAYENILEIAKSNQKDIFTLHWDPTTTEMKKKFYLEQIELMTKIYSPLVPDGKKIHLLFLGKDKEWAKNLYETIGKDNLGYVEDSSTSYTLNSNCTLKDGFLLPEAIYPAPFTTYRGRGGGINTNFAQSMVAYSNCDQNNIEMDLLPHETFHAVQFSNSYISKEWPGSRKSFETGNIPPWVNEGQATYFGYLLIDFPIWKSYAQTAGRWLYGNATLRWQKEFNYLTTYETGDPYWIGAVMSEYMIAKFGIKKTLKLYDETIKRVVNFLPNQEDRYKPFNESFQANFGQSVESFYLEVKSYIQWSYNLAKKG